MRISCLLVFLFFGLKITNGLNPEKLLQKGHDALARGDNERAAALYERAEMHSTNPAEAAFYLAEANYRLAMKIEGVSPELIEAEKLYRCCLCLSDPHRPYALCGLGNCLLRKAGSSDEGSLRAAIASYDLCLQSGSEDKAVKSAARYNREKARVLLLQFLPPTRDPVSDRPPRDDLHPHLPRPYDFRQAVPPPDGVDGNEGSADAQSGSRDAKQNQGKDATKNNEPPQPGKGNLPPIPDEVEVPPLSSHIADEHLELAAKKVLKERQEQNRRDEETAAKGVKDW